MKTETDLDVGKDTGMFVQTYVSIASPGESALTAAAWERARALVQVNEPHMLIY